MMVLVVDDNAVDRKILRYTLERHGCQVIEAADGEEGLETARSHRPALIVSDALMPKMDGFQFLRKVRSDPDLRTIPFIFYSSVYTGDRDVKLALSLGACAFVAKPKKPEEFWAEVTAVLDGEGTHRDGSRAELLEEEEEYLRQYSHIVASKIEEKVLELERANALIRQKAKSYRNLFESIRDVIIVTDDARTVLNANQPALRETFGYETEEIIGSGELLLYADEEGYLSIGWAFSGRGDFACTPVEVSLRRKNGDIFIGELCAVRRIDEEGVPSGNIVMIRDVTERKRGEEMLHRIEEERLLYQAELMCAAEVQSNLLPRHFPELPGFEIAARCLPAHQVGGDFFDWQDVAPGVVALTLGDVMGNGMPAAILMATVRATMHAVGQQNQPAKALQLAERALRVDLESSDRFVTLFHARLNANTRTLTFVDCGHGYVFLRRANGEVEELNPRGLPLGVQSGESYLEGSVTFGEGDALVLYSDGLIDARPELSLENRDLAERLAGATSAQDMVDLITAMPALEGPPPDDLTVLVAWCRKEGYLS